MNAVIENLRAALRGAFDEYRNRVHGRLELAEEEASRTERELSDIQERLRKIADSHILDKDRILGDIMDLRRNLQNIKMNQESDRVIVESITKRIAETQARAKEQIANDTVLKEIQQIIERQQQQVTAAKLLADRGMAGEDKIVEAEQNLSRARIELAQRKEELSRSAGGNEIESLNRQLADRSIQESQNQARIAALNKQLAEQEDLLNKTDDYELLSLKTDIAKQNLQEALIWRDRISRQMRLIQPPMVSVLGGE
jgi:chromosome segregation ATPase